MQDKTIHCDVAKTNDYRRIIIMANICLKRLMAFASFVSATMAHANDDIVCDFRVGINSTECCFVCSITNKTANVFSMVPFSAGYFDTSIFAETMDGDKLEFSEHIRVGRMTEVPTVIISPLASTNLICSVPNAIRGYETIIPYGEYLLWSPNVIPLSSGCRMSYANTDLPVALLTNATCIARAIPNRRYVGIAAIPQTNIVECVGFSGDFAGGSSNITISVTVCSTRQSASFVLPYNAYDVISEAGSDRIRFNSERLVGELENIGLSISNGVRAIDVHWERGDLMSETIPLLIIQ